MGHTWAGTLDILAEFNSVHVESLSTASKADCEARFLDPTQP
jgi:hypothetical protein